MDDYLSTRAPSSSSKTVFQKKFSIYSFSNRKMEILSSYYDYKVIIEKASGGRFLWNRN